MQDSVSLNAIDIVVLVAYFAAMLGLGLYQTKKVKHSGDFFAGGRSFNKFLMMMHALGTGTHADDPVGVVGASFKNGLAGIWYTFVYLFVTPFYWIMAPLFRRSRFLTTADFFEARFGTPLGTLYAVWGVLIFAVNMGTLLIGTGIIVDAVSGGAIPSIYAILGMTLVFLIYGTAGGLHATVAVEAVQGVLIVVMSLLLVPFGLAQLGDGAGMMAGVQSLGEIAQSDKWQYLLEITGLEEVSLPWIIGGFVMNLINIVAQPHTMEVCSTGKTEWEGRVGFTYGNFMKRFCALGWAFTGVIVAAMVAKGMIDAAQLGNREDAFGIAIRVLLPPGFTGIMFAAVLAAQMSTLSAFMVAASALLSRNVIQRYFVKGADDKALLGFGRVAGLGTVALGVLFALTVRQVADALMWFWTLSTFTGLFMWSGVLWKRTNATGAWASFIIMLVIWLGVGEPGAFIAERTAKASYTKATGIDVVANLPDEYVVGDRVLVDIVHKDSQGKWFREDKVALATRDVTGGFGVEVQKASSDDVLSEKEAAEVFEDGNAVEGLVVTSVADESLAKKNGIKEGDMILATSEMGFLGRFADKKLLHFRALSILPAGLIALIIGSLLGKPHPEDKLRKFYKLITTPVGREQELVEAGVDAVYIGSTEGSKWELEHPVLVNWVGFGIAVVISAGFFGVLYSLSMIGK